MPKFNEFIKGFEEKETEQPKVEAPKTEAPKAEEPKDKGTTQTPANTFKPLSKAETEDMEKGEIPNLNDVRKYLQNHPEYGDVNIHEFQYDDGEKVLTGDIRKDGKLVARIEFDKDGNPVNNHGQVYSEIDFSEKGEQVRDKQEWKPSQRIVNYGGKDMTFEEAKEAYKKAVAIPTLKRTPKQEAYLDKSAEYDIAQDELYKKWYEEKDPQKKAELKEQLDTLDKEYESFLNEWKEAERNRYKKTR